MGSNRFTLNNENFKETISALEKSLLELKLKERDIMNSMLLVEELFLRFSSIQKDFHCDIEIKKVFGNCRLLMTSEGEACNPLEAIDTWDKDDENHYRTLILRSRKRQLAYTRKNARNIVTIIVKSEDNQFRRTLTAMILGILFGIVLKEFVPEYIVSFIDKNIITSIRTMFLNSLNMMIAPVVFFSIIAGLTSMANASDVGRIGGKLILMYMCTTIIAAVFAMTLSTIIFHSGLPVIGHVTSSGEGVSVSIVEMIVGVIPKDLITPIIKRDMLQIIFVAFLFGTAINVMREKAAILSRFAEIMNTLNLRIIAMIARFIPLVAFLSMTSLILTLGVESLYLLCKVVLGQITGGILMIGVYVAFLIIIGRISPLPFLRKLVSFLLVPASMGSSTATMPFTMKFCTEKMGVAPSLSSFSIPLGATVNMDGSCFYFSIFTIMAAKMYGIEITPNFLLSLFIAIMAFSIGAPGVPGGVFVCLTSIVVSFGMPPEATAFALGVEPLVSLFRMTINVIGDIAATTALASSEKLLNVKTYNQ